MEVLHYKVYENFCFLLKGLVGCDTVCEDTAARERVSAIAKCLPSTCAIKYSIDTASCAFRISAFELGALLDVLS